MNIKGTYVIKSGGETIAEFENMLTTNGLYVINQYLSGQTRYWADSLAIGALSSSATSASTKSLQYELLRYPVLFKNYINTGSSTNKIILKATVDPTTEFRAFEIGIFPNSVNLDTFTDHRQITSFSEISSGQSAWTINSTAATSGSSTASPRFGNNNIILPVTTSSTTNTASITGLSLDSSRYTDNDYVGILYYVSSSISSTSVTVTLGDNSIPQLTWTGSTTLSSTPSGAYYSALLDMSTKSDSFTEPIATASIQFRGSAGSVVLDQMKFVLGDTLTTDNQLVSRSTSSAANSPLFTKTYSQPMDIEYYIQVT